MTRITRHGVLMAVLLAGWAGTSPAMSAGPMPPDMPVTWPPKDQTETPRPDAGGEANRR